MPITSDWKITHNGKTYAAGDVIEGLTAEEELALINTGKAKRVRVVEAAEGSLPSSEEKQQESNSDSDTPGDDGTNDAANDDLDSDEVILTPEQFGRLSAGEQKNELAEIGLEPDSNAAARLAQYAEWYNQNGDE